jgi:signal transduction histidine kinase/ligand-binding sensor domain-containing protein/CheY-like chemotaxis protein
MQMKFAHVPYIALCLLAVLYNPLTAQYDAPAFRHLTTEDGLSENHVNAIYQDEQGFMWFGTFDGLNRYDGYTVTTYKPDPNRANTLPGRLVFCLTGDREGGLWIGTTGTGLSRFDTRRERFLNFRHDPGRPNSIISDMIKEVFVDRSDRLWVGTDRGISLLDLAAWRREGATPASARFTHLLAEPVKGKRPEVSDVFQDGQGTVWVVTPDQLYRIAETEDGMVALPVDLIGLDANTDQPELRRMTELPDGRLVIGCKVGLLVSRAPVREGLAVTLIQGSEVDDMTLDTIGRQLVVGTTTGLYTFAYRDGLRANKRYAYEPYNDRSLANNTVEALYTDRGGLVWVGTFGGGVDVYDPYGKPFYTWSAGPGVAGLSSNSIRALYQDSRQRVWIGTIGGGVNIHLGSLWPGRPEPFTRLRVPGRIYAIGEVRDAYGHYIYLGTDDGPGLYRLPFEEPAAEAAEPVQGVRHAVFSILQDSRGAVWFGTYSGGLIRWWPDPEEPTGYRETYIDMGASPGKRLPSNIIRSLLEDRNGDIWVGTGEGLVRLRTSLAKGDELPAAQVFRNEPGNRHSISHDYILPIHEDALGRIWVGTLGGGVNRFVPANEGRDEHFEQLTEADGLPNGIVKSLLSDEQDRLWIASNRGITRYDPVAEELVHFNRSDGLASSEYQEIAGLRQDNGLLAFGGVNGLDLFDPDSIRTSPVMARPVLTSLDIENEPIRVGEKYRGREILTYGLSRQEGIVLRHDENSLAIGFSSQHYSAPGKVTYAFMLEGFDEDWIYTDASQRRAVYTNLPYDDYVFRVKATNADGLWGDDVTSLNVIVRPPPWFRWYAFVLYGILVLAFLYLYRRYSLIEVREKNRLIIEDINREKDREVNRLKFQFFTNVSHELRTPLSLILGPLQALMADSEPVAGDKRRYYYDLMYQNARYLLGLVDQLLDFRCLDRGMVALNVQPTEITEFVARIAARYRFQAERDGIDFAVHQPKPQQVHLDRDVVAKVVNNLLSNAFKFTPGGGRIDLHITIGCPEQKAVSSPLPTHGPHLRIVVRDTGRGISRGRIAKIFDRFQKGSDPEGVNRRGAGIGLAYAKGLIDLHRGCIEVDSRLHRGTTFNVTIPVSSGVYSSREKSEAREDLFVAPAEELVTGEGSLAKIAVPSGEDQERPLLLYIDDNEDLRNFVRLSLADDFRIVVAEGGRAGIDLARSANPDIILSDVMMPEVDGLEVLDQLKQDVLTSHIPIILLTARSGDDNRHAGIRGGADAYLTKPFRLDTLRLQLTNIVERRKRMQAQFRRDIITEPSEVTVTHVDEAFLKQAMDIVEENMSNTDFSVEQMVRDMGVSRSKLYLKLKALTGQSTSEFIRSVRLKRAARLMENSGYSVKEVMYKTGFNTASYFSKCFRQQFGVVPSEYLRRQNEEESAS